MSKSVLRAGPLARVFLGATVGMAALIVWAIPASAHVDFVGSTPANVSTVPAPISEIVLEYSGAANPIVDDFRVENASGDLMAIRSVATDGSNKVVVSTIEQLPAGRTKVLWALRGTDGHKMSGSISFTVTQAPIAGASVPPVTTNPGNQPSSDNAIADDLGLGSQNPPETYDGRSTENDSGIAETVGVLARWCVYGAILLTVGALAYLFWVHRGTRTESRRIVFFIRRASVVVLFGAIVEWLAQLILWNGGGIGDLARLSVWVDLGTEGFALGTALRIVGAILVLRFVAIEVVADSGADDPADADLNWIAGPKLSGSVALEPVSQSTQRTRVRVESGPLAAVGALLLIFSESFIGHTASSEPRVLMVVSDAVHLAAAGVWAAGAWLLAATLWHRRKRNQPLDARLLAVRFSLLATWSLIAVSVSGVLLAWAILDQLSALWESQFGRLLMAKVAVVAIIGSFGLHNRRVLLPALQSGDQLSEERFRKTIMVESGLFVFVLLLTSLLVIANPFP